MQSMKERAANVGASAISGMEKTKATVQEKMEKMGAQSETEEEMAREKKEERKENAELRKQQARHHNAAANHSASASAAKSNPQSH